MRLTQLATIAAVTGVVVAPSAVLAPAASASTAAVNSAYGVAATGLISIPPVPAVSSANGPAHDKLLELPANPLVKAKLVSVSATSAQARADVAEVRVGKVGLSAQLITAKCVQGKASSKLLKVTLNGRALQATAAPNTAVTVGVGELGAVSLILNKQARDAHGRMTVTALELSVPLGPGKVETISIASATCGGVTAGRPTATPSPSHSTPPGAAPTPTPVTGDLPVTG